QDAPFRIIPPAIEKEAPAETDQTDFYTVRAPFDGVVGRLEQVQGHQVEEGDILTTLSDNSAMWAYFNVPKAGYRAYLQGPDRVREDPKIELVLADGTLYPEVGKLGAVEADSNAASDTVPFRADFSNPKRVLHHGQTGTVLVRRVLNNALVVPQQATFEAQGKRYVYTIDKDDVAHQREIAVEDETEGLFVVKEGLRAGEKIVVEGVARVQDGEKVKYEAK
ncbi:MAG TPA: efflux RND transporter periplasmic adaptor subunit, partial [Pirellulales bacterium]|nr:efflux RND transporter periplasmic adaptor subunit [Pirellulales bacterium]